MKKTLRIVIPLLLIAAFVAGGLLIRTQTVKKEAYYEKLVADAQSERDAAQMGYDTVDTSAVDAVTADLEALQTENASMEESIRGLTEENAGLDTDMDARQQEYDRLAQEEDNAYYLAIYESLMEGMTKVEGYINNP